MDACVNVTCTQVKLQQWCEPEMTAPSLTAHMWLPFFSRYTIIIVNIMIPRIANINNIYIAILLLCNRSYWLAGWLEMRLCNANPLQICCMNMWWILIFISRSSLEASRPTGRLPGKVAAHTTVSTILLQLLLRFNDGRREEARVMQMRC